MVAVVARQAHNLEVVGSIPTPATRYLYSVEFIPSITKKHGDNIVLLLQQKGFASIYKQR